MAMTAGTVACSTKLTVSGTYPPQGAGTALQNFRVSQQAPVAVTTLTFGTGSGLVDLITCSDKVITASSSATYDLYTGTDLKDLAGLTCAFRTVRLIQVSIVSGGTASGVRVGGAASDEWVGFFVAAGDKIDVFPGGPPYLAGSPAGKAVGASTKNLKLENLGASDVTVRITIAGASA